MLRKTACAVLTFVVVTASSVSLADDDRGFDHGDRDRGDRNFDHGDRDHGDRNFDHGDRGGDHGRDFRDHDRWREHIDRFHHHDDSLWRAGHWYHGRNNGVYGWWWLAGGESYLYTHPVYPFPDPYAPPDVVVSQPPPRFGAAPGSVAPPRVYYYCNDPAGYYPDVATCAQPWTPVPPR